MMITLLTVAMIGLLGLVLLLQHGLQREERYLQANAEAIARQMEPYLAVGAPSGRIEELARTSAFLIDARVEVLDAEGQAVADSGSGRVGEELIWIGPHGASPMALESIPRAASSKTGGGEGPLVIGILAGAAEEQSRSFEEHASEVLDAHLESLQSPSNEFMEEGAIFVRLMGSHLDGRIEFHRERLEVDPTWTGADFLEEVQRRPEEILRIETGNPLLENRGESGTYALEGILPPSDSYVTEDITTGTLVSDGSAAISGDVAPTRSKNSEFRIEILRTLEAETRLQPPLEISQVEALAGLDAPSPAAEAAEAVEDFRTAERRDYVSVSEEAQMASDEVHALKTHLQLAAGGLHGRSQRGASVPIGGVDAPLGWVEVSQGPSFQGETLGAATRAFGLAALIASVLAGAVGLVFSRGMTAPLARLTEATDRMGAGDFAARAPVDGHDEIAGLAEQFNRMAEDLEASFEALEAERDALRHFIADASHELRTPITALKNFNTLLQGPAAGDDAARQEFLAEGARQIERLEWMTQHLLDLSRLEAGLIELEREPVSVGELVDGALKPLEHRYEARNMRMALEDLDGDLVIDCDGQRLQMVLKNLAENALKYGREGGTLWLSTVVSEEGLLIRACDDGRGVPLDEQERVFERFYRASNAGEEAGDGLGLAIARSVVRAHGGELRCEDHEESGACFVMELPDALRT